MPLYTPPLESATQIRERFLGNLNGLLGDVRLLWTPKVTDTTTSTDETWNQSTLTADATMAAQITALGNGFARSFNGSSNYLTTPTRTSLSFGNGSADSAFSVFALANVTNTAAARTFLSKYTTSNLEWFFQVDSSDLLRFGVADNSVGITVSNGSNGAITQGAPHLFGATYSGVGGASAMGGVVLWADAQGIASTANNGAGTYVAMEQLGAACEIGSLLTHAASFGQGQIALAGVVAGVLTAAQWWSMKRLVNAFYGLSL